jgi:hypothetical protein
MSQMTGHMTRQVTEPVAVREVVNLVVHDVPITLRFLDRSTLALCRAQLWLVLERTTDSELRGNLMCAIDDLIRQDAIQAALNLSDND